MEPLPFREGELYETKNTGRSRGKLWKLVTGADFSGERVAFRVWAPRANSVRLKIEEVGDVSMNPEEKGYFSCRVKGLEPGARYFYVLDRNEPRPDPVSRFQPHGVHGPSEVIDPNAFSWEDSAWKGIPLEDMILYEIHTGTFTPEGTFEAMIPRLEYLKDELGVTALELMPVGQFPGGRNWGYDGAYLYAPQNTYGGPFGLKKLIDACHRKGLAVILDVVYNHLGPEGNYISEYGPYFTDQYKTPWGLAVNFDGPESDEVRRFFMDNALYWVTEYHLDGLRLDAIHRILDFSPRHILEEIREAVHREGEILGRKLWVIAESDLNDVRIINSPRRGGYGLDSQWSDDFHHSLHTLLTGERSGYYQDFGDIRQLAKALRQGFVYTGQYSPHRKRRHGSESKYLPPSKFVVSAQNHDQVGNRRDGERLSSLIPPEALKLAAALTLLSPQIPLLFMGEEYGETAPFLYFISHIDPGLVEAVRRGRREEFSDFHGKGEPPDPQDELTFNRCKIHPEQREEGVHRRIFQFYHRLIRLRKEIPSLRHPDKRGLKISLLPEKKVLIMFRTQGEDQVCCFFHFGPEPQVIPSPIQEGTWRNRLDSSSTEWGGPGAFAPESISPDGAGTISLRPYNALLYCRRKEKEI